MTRALGFGLLAIVAAVLAIGPFLAAGDPRAVETAAALRPPSVEHPLGTDPLGRDVLGRLAAGARGTLVAVAVALLVSTAIGVAIGAGAGLTGGLVDRAASSSVDLLLAFPQFVILVNAAALFDFATPLSIGLLIGLISWMGTARYVRTEILSLRERAFVEAARASGAAGGRIVGRHLLPHVARLVVERLGLRFAGVALTASSFDYLGIGLAADRPSWGGLIRDGQAYLESAPWIALPAVGLLAASTVGIVLVFDRTGGGA